MTTFRTCVGCIMAGEPCDKRKALGASIRGLGITSVKFKCDLRLPKWRIGQAVWARLQVGPDDGDRGPYYADFPAVVVAHTSQPTRELLYVHEGETSKDGYYTFDPKNNGFAKVSMSRLSLRHADDETVCSICQRPSQYGHAEYCSNGVGHEEETILWN